MLCSETPLQWQASVTLTSPGPGPDCPTGSWRLQGCIEASVPCSRFIANNPLTWKTKNQLLDPPLELDHLPLARWGDGKNKTADVTVLPFPALPLT